MQRCSSRYRKCSRYNTHRQKLSPGKCYLSGVKHKGSPFEKAHNDRRQYYSFIVPRAYLLIFNTYTYIHTCNLIRNWPGSFQSVQAYSAVPLLNATTKGEILYTPDLFGLYSNSKLVADDFAPRGYLILISDIFLSNAMLPDIFSNPEFCLQIPQLWGCGCRICGASITRNRRTVV